jgi:ectoine hydroxylase-related dioxygenase (phytanoyl-CoA dioxygenase family)
MIHIDLTTSQIEQFNEDGFLILDRLLEADEVTRTAARFEPLFRGEFETGLYPDEWNWQEGRDAPDRTRQICNGWKSDRAIAALVLHEQVGRMCAQLAGWPGARIAQDNVLWKPPGAKPLGFHQDNSYIKWCDPPAYLTCWIALDETHSRGGTIEYVRGSHRWGKFPPIRQFHAPDDYREAMREAARTVGHEPEIVPVEVPPGGCALHHGDTWHGSDTNRGTMPRRSTVAHCISSEARYHPTEIGYIYSRYKRVDDLSMDESYFPILWRQDGYRSPFLDPYIRGERAVASDAKAGATALR